MKIDIIFNRICVRPAKSRDKTSKRDEDGRMLKALQGAPLAMLGFVQLAAIAAPPSTQLPVGAQVSAGQASISQSGASMSVDQFTRRAVIDWNTYNVGSAATIHYNQPNAQSVTLNRVLSSNPSEIFGKIYAPGQVYLINPNGIYFSPSASVDVGGLVATTFSMNNADFMAGKTTFARNGSTKSVINEGTLAARDTGYIAMLAPEVRNSGVIIARKGAAVLASGEFVTLNFDANSKLISITVTPSEITSLVENRLAIEAPDGLIILSSQAANRLIGGVIKNSGVIAANSLVNDGGRVLLQASDSLVVSGGISATSQGGKGGSIVLAGDRIAIADGARISVTGATGGGEIAVGGGWQGSGGIVPATTVHIEKNAVLDASATDFGNGGTVVAWSDVGKSDSSTRVYGSLLAKGGINGGNGGRIETSGYWLDVNGIVADASAKRGTSGNWLLDPYDITISSGADTGAGFTATADNTVINTTTLQNALATTDVTVSTGGGGAQSGNITVQNPITWASARQLTLNSTGTTGIISINAPITTGGGALTVIGPRFAVNNTSITTNGGALTVTASGGGGTAISLTGATLNVGSGTGMLTATTSTTTGTAFSGTNSITSTGAGSFSISATTSAAAANPAIRFSDGTQLTVAGNTSISGSNLSSYIGILFGTTNLINTSGNLTITGSSVSNAGIQWRGAQSITNSGTLSYLGSSSSYRGLDNGAGTLPSFTIAGNVSLTGNAQTGIGANLAGNSFTLLSGNLTMNATSGTGVGIFITGTDNSFTNQGTGTISVVGQHTGTSSTGYGVLLTTGSKVTGAGTVSLSGTSVDASGIHMESNSALAASSGNFSVNGTSTSASGVGVTSNTTLNNSGAGTLTVSGTSTSGTGLLLSTGSSVTTSGTTALLGATTSGNGIKIDSGASVSGANPVLAATGSFVNNAGSNAVTATSGRWLIYSSAPGTNTFGGLDSANTALWNASYASMPPSAVTASGNRYLFASQPMLTVITGNLSKVYGTDLSGSLAATYSISGLQSGVSNAFLGDTSATAYSGVPTVTSTGAAANAPVAASPHSILASQGSLTSPSGYGFQFQNDGLLTIAPYSVNLSGSRVYDGTANMGANVFSMGALVGTETLTVTGTGTVSSKNVANNATVSLGSLALGDGTNGGLASNYTFTGGAQTASITPANLTISTSNVTKAYDGTTATNGSAIVTGGALFGSDSLSGGAFVFADKNAGNNKTVMTSGVSVNDGNGGQNYNVSYADNISSTISKAPLSVAANNDTKTYDGLAYTGGNGVRFNGFVNGETSLVLNGALYYAGSSQGAINAGNYPVKPSGLSSGNYDISYTDGILTVNKARLSASIIGVSSKTYNGNPLASLTADNFSLQGFVGSESATVVNQNIGYYDGIRIGDHIITAPMALNNFLPGRDTLLTNYIWPTIAQGPGRINPMPTPVFNVELPKRDFQCRASQSGQLYGSSNCSSAEEN